MLAAQWLGVPQEGQRVVFVGVLLDLGLGPVFPPPLPYRYSVRDAIPWIESIRSGSGVYLPSELAPSSVIVAAGARTSETAQFDAGGVGKAPLLKTHKGHPPADHPAPTLIAAG